MIVTLVIPDELSELYTDPSAAPVDTDTVSFQAHLLLLQQVIAIQEAVITLQDAGLKVEILRVNEEETFMDDDDL